jgi:hypothetical protein
VRRHWTYAPGNGAGLAVSGDSSVIAKLQSALSLRRDVAGPCLAPAAQKGRDQESQLWAGRCRSPFVSDTTGSATARTR